MDPNSSLISLSLRPLDKLAWRASSLRRESALYSTFNLIRAAISSLSSRIRSILGSRYMRLVSLSISVCRLVAICFKNEHLPCFQSHESESSGVALSFAPIPNHVGTIAVSRCRPSSNSVADDANARKRSRKVCQRNGWRRWR